MYRSILVGTDDSPEADEAIRRALDLAEMDDASLHAIYVVNSRFDRTEAMKEPFVQAGRRVLSEIERNATDRNLDLTTVLEEGHPAETILDYAETHGVDLIVLGGKEKSAAERFFIGNTAEKVVRHAPVSVLVVRE